MKYTMDFFATAIDAVLRDALVEKAVVVGHSNGTPVARQFWRKFPQKTYALVFVDGTLRPFAKDAKEWDQFVAPLREPTYKDYAGKFIDSMITTHMPADVKAGVKSTILATPQHVMVSSLESLMDPAVWKEDTIDVPVLALQAKSPAWTAEYEAFAKKLCPKIDYRVIDDVGHFVMMEKPGEFNAVLAEFLQKQNWPKRPS